MPTTYAHCRFGEDMLLRMPADVRGTAKRYRQLFDVGLQGPDLLFYYRPVLTGKVHRLGQKYHMQTGKEFFSRVCRNLRREPSEGGQAYLYGVLCHFALDANCRPLVAHVESPAGAESAFDRFLMDLDGLFPGGQWLRMALTEREWGIVSRFYPGTDRRVLQKSVRCMAKTRRIPNQERADWNQLLLAGYQRAAEQFPEMLLKLIAHLQYNAPLGEKFDPIFG